MADKEQNELLQKLGEEWEKFKETNGERLDKLEATGVDSSELKEKQERIETSFDEIKDRLDKIEAKANQPVRTINENEVPEPLYKHEDAWEDWVRAPKDPAAIQALKEAEAEATRSVALLPRRLQRKYNVKGHLEFAKIQEDDRTKAITISPGTGGGNAIPTLVHDRIVSKAYDMSPIRQIANVAQSSNENHRFLVIDNNAAGGWVPGGGARTETATSLFQAVTLTYGTAYAYPFVWEEALDDMTMDVGGFVEQVSAEVLAAQEGTAFVSGNGTARPTGFLNGTPVTTGDEDSPARAFGTLQYFPTGAAANFQNDPIDSPAGDPAQVLFDVVYGIKAQYRANARWVMNKNTLGRIRTFRDANGNYLYLPGLVAGQPDVLLNYPLTEAEAMPNVGANANVAVFGDWQKGYQVGDIVGTLRITIDDNITQPGFVKFYIRRRVGGNVLDDDALKVVRCSVS